MSKHRVIALAAAAVLGLSSAVTLDAVATPTPTPLTTSSPTTAPSPTATPTQSWGWPQATFKGRTMTITNLKPGWEVAVSLLSNQTGKEARTYRATAQQSGSVTIQLTGVPAGSYDIWIQAGDLPANESHYPDVHLGPETTPSKPKPGTGSSGLAKTGV